MPANKLRGVAVMVAVNTLWFSLIKTDSMQGISDHKKTVSAFCVFIFPEIPFVIKKKAVTTASRIEQKLTRKLPVKYCGIAGL